MKRYPSIVDQLLGCLAAAVLVLGPTNAVYADPAALSPNASAGTAFTLKTVGLRVDTARPTKPHNGRIRVRGVLDPTQFDDSVFDTLDLGFVVGVTGVGLATTETMEFDYPRCIELSAAHIKCIGTLGEVANFRRQRRAPHAYGVDIVAPRRSFAAPLSKVPVRVVLSTNGVDRRADLATCKIYLKRIAACRP